MTKLSEKAQAIYDAVPADGSWIDPITLEGESGLSIGDYFSHVASLTRRKLVERGPAGDYRRTSTP